MSRRLGALKPPRVLEVLNPRGHSHCFRQRISRSTFQCLMDLQPVGGAWKLRIPGVRGPRRRGAVSLARRCPHMWSREALCCYYLREVLSEMVLSRVSPRDSPFKLFPVPLHHRRKSDEMRLHLIEVKHVEEAAHKCCGHSSTRACRHRQTCPKEPSAAMRMEHTERRSSRNQPQFAYHAASKAARRRRQNLRMPAIWRQQGSRQAGRQGPC